jgi:hypothetical protein
MGNLSGKYFPHNFNPLVSVSKKSNEALAILLFPQLYLFLCKKKLLNMLSKLLTISVLVLSSLLFLAPLTAQSKKFGTHVGLIAAKMLWADKQDKDTWSIIRYPDTQFKYSVSAGLSYDIDINSKWYSPIQLDLLHRRFAISTDGVVFYYDQNGQLTAYLSDQINYRVNQLSLSAGLGHHITPWLGLEILPYFQYAITAQEARIAKGFAWQNDPNFQQNYDFGLSGYLRFRMNRFYFKTGYQFGIREGRNYSAFDEQGLFIGKFPVRNTLLLVLLGIKF